MCGIIAAFKRTPKNKHGKAEKVNKDIMDQYQDQCSRGQRGFGIIRISEKGKIQIDRATQENKFLLDLYLKPANMILAHHRQPTSSENKIIQTHPIYISNKLLKHNYYFMHNGMVGNDKELHKKLTEIGFKYTTEYTKKGYTEYYPDTIEWNDTESLAIEVALMIEEIQPNVETNSTAAFIMLQINKKTNTTEKLFFGRNGINTCLNIFQDQKKGILKISSEGEGESVEEGKLFSFDINDKNMILTKKEMIFEKPAEPEPEVKIVHIHNNNHLNLPITKTIENETTKTTEITKGKVPGNKNNTVTIEIRKWVGIDENTYEDFDDSCFVDKKSYKEDMCKEVKDSIKEDNADSIETSIETLLDDQKSKIEDIIGLYEKTLLTRKIGVVERNYYMSQIFHVLRAMEAMTDIAEEEFDIKIIEEETKKEETGKETYDDDHVGYRPRGRTYHNYKTGEMQEETGIMNWG